MSEQATEAEPTAEPVTTRQIREWAQEAGHDVPVRGRLGDEWRDLYSEAHPGAVFASGDNPRLSPVEPEGSAWGDVPEEPRPAVPAAYAETRPQPPAAEAPSGWMGRLKAKAGGGGGAAGKRKGRVSLEEMAAGAWTMIGGFLGGQGLVPTGRVLAAQAPVAGVILEEALRGTAADALLQPLARSGDALREINALIMPPLLVSIISMNPARAEQLVPQLRRSMRTWVLIAGPRMKELEKREKKAMRDMGVESPEELDAVIEDMIGRFFAPPEFAPPVEQPDAA